MLSAPYARLKLNDTFKRDIEQKTMLKQALNMLTESLIVINVIVVILLPQRGRVWVKKHNE